MYYFESEYGTELIYAKKPPYAFREALRYYVKPHYQECYILDEYMRRLVKLDRENMQWVSLNTDTN